MPASELKPSLAAKLIRLSPLAVAVAFVLFVLFVMSFNVESSAPSSTPESLQVSISASPANPTAGQSVTLTASVSNAPTGFSPSYKWEMSLGGGWHLHGARGNTLSFLANRAETWAFRVTVSYGNGDSATSDSLSVSWTNPAPTASPANPFLGQQVTLTAPSMSTQAATSYQWQRWSGSAWTDQGSASTSSTLDLSSPDSASVLAYRVAVTYGTGAEATTATSSAVVVEWKPVVISLTSSPEFPLSGQADKRTVTLTAGGDVPSGATYQWQEWSGTAWTNLGTASAAATKTVSSTSRGAKKYQVVVSHTSASSVTS